MSQRPDYLYDLLPAIYRQRDAEQSEALRSLFAALQAQHDLIETDIAALYRNWFAETCEPWALPYIGELVAAGRLARRPHPEIDTRALVGNTLRYRRRKGTAATLEQAVSQATGWPALLVETRERLAMTAAAGRPAKQAPTTADLRAATSAARIGTPFETMARGVTARPGWTHGLDRLDMHFWRLQSYPLRQVDAGRHSRGEACRAFHPLGLDMPLFNRRVARDDGGVRADIRSLPIPLTAALLRPETGAGASRPPRGFFTGLPVLSIWIEEARDPSGWSVIEPEDMAIADLSAWRPPAGTARIAVDPERGRMLLPRWEDRDKAVVTDHCQGFADDLGGGCYARARSPTALDLDGAETWSNEPWRFAAGGEGRFDLGEALADWNRGAGARPRDGFLEIPNSRSHGPPGDERGGSRPWSIDLGAARGRRLVIRAKNGQRPCLRGGLRVSGGGPGATLILDGLMIGGGLGLEGGMTVTIRHCTLVGAGGGPALVAASPARVTMESSIVEGVRFDDDGILSIRESIIDGGAGDAVAGSGAGPTADIVSATIRGKIHARRIRASDTIFLDGVDVAETHEGYARHSYFANADNSLPTTFRCLWGPDAPAPSFSSRRLGHPGYYCLTPETPRAILTGATDGMALGAFRALGEVIRQDNYEDAKMEYLPHGCDILSFFEN